MEKCEEGVLAWHFLPADGKLRYGSRASVEAGKIYSIANDERVEICACGMHGSVRAIDAIAYAPGSIACRVEIWGDVKSHSDKLAGRHRKVLWMADATTVLHRFAVWCVRQPEVWRLLTDERSRRAIEVKELWLDGKATDKELNAARAAAGAAARAAARAAAEAAAEAAARAAAGAAARAAAEAAAWAAARAAARAAAEAAAWDAAEVAAEAAAWAAARAAAGAAARAAAEVAAEAAAWAAAGAAQNAKLTKMLLELEPKTHE